MTYEGEAVAYFAPPLGGPTDDQVRAAEAVLDSREDALAEQTRGTLVKCTSQVATGKGCGTLHAIKDLTYIQTHWYTSPHGCSGGDYWNRGEGQFICPSCGHRNRLYASPEVEVMKQHFKSVEDTYRD